MENPRDAATDIAEINYLAQQLAYRNSEIDVLLGELIVQRRYIDRLEQKLQKLEEAYIKINELILSVRKTHQQKSEMLEEGSHE